MVLNPEESKETGAGMDIVKLPKTIKMPHPIRSKYVWLRFQGRYLKESE